MQLVAGQQPRFQNALAVDIGAVPRTKIAHAQSPIGNIDATMPAAEPAVVNLNRRVVSPAELNGEPIHDDFARRREGVLANEFELHERGGQRGPHDPCGRAQAGCFRREAAEAALNDML